MKPGDMFNRAKKIGNKAVRAVGIGGVAKKAARPIRTKLLKAAGMPTGKRAPAKPLMKKLPMKMKRAVPRAGRRIA